MIRTVWSRNLDEWRASQQILIGQSNRISSFGVELQPIVEPEGCEEAQLPIHASRDGSARDNWSVEQKMFIDFCWVIDPHALHCRFIRYCHSRTSPKDDPRGPTELAEAAESHLQMFQRFQVEELEHGSLSRLVSVPVRSCPMLNWTGNRASVPSEPLLKSGAVRARVNDLDNAPTAIGFRELSTSR